MTSGTCCGGCPTGYPAYDDNGFNFLFHVWNVDGCLPSEIHTVSITEFDGKTKRFLMLFEPAIGEKRPGWQD